MNYKKLVQAEAQFLQMYPGGFADPELQEVGKKHRLDKMNAMARDVLAKKQFKQPHQLLDNLIKLVSRSSMVSLFEKPKFRDVMNSLPEDERDAFVQAYRKLIHGNQQKGLEEAVEILARYKLAKWSLLTIGLIYYRPDDEVFVKPTTAKKINEGLELGLTYKPRPSWEFYDGYRSAILEIKERVHPSLAVNNAALTGFLMMTL